MDLTQLDLRQLKAAQSQSGGSVQLDWREPQLTAAGRALVEAGTPLDWVIAAGAPYWELPPPILLSATQYEELLKLSRQRGRFQDVSQAIRQQLTDPALRKIVI